MKTWIALRICGVAALTTAACSASPVGASGDTSQPGADAVVLDVADADAATVDAADSQDAADASDAGDSAVLVDAAPDTPPDVLTTWPGSWACPAAPEPACGGALEGTTWTVVDFCPEDPTAAAALFEHPYDNLPACQPPGGTVKGQLVDSGEISFADGQLAMNIGGYAETTYTFSPACLQAAKPGPDPAATCTSMSKLDIMTCTYGPTAQGSDQCTCLAKVPKEGGKDSAPYAIVGGKTLKIGTEISADYCIQGDRLLLDVTPHIISWRWWLFKRKL